MHSRDGGDASRREFLRQAIVAAGCTAGRALSAHGAAAGRSGAETVAIGNPRVFIVSDPSDPVASSAPAQWSAGQLREALAARGVGGEVGQQLAQSPAGALCILACGHNAAMARPVLAAAAATVPDSPESLGLVAGRLDGRAVLLACGSDARGLSYALLELADRVQHASAPLAALEVPQPVVERPANRVRSIMRLFASEVEDKAWFNDKAFWREYLSLLAAQRFNRFALTLGLGYDFPRNLRDTYFHFAYPFLLSPPGYDVRASGLPDAERDRNLEMLRFISDESALRGLHFQLGLWTHAFQWTDSPNVNYTIEGLTPAKHAGYCQAALYEILRACPSIAGITFRVHGESGVAEGSYEFWKSVFQGAVRSGRQIEIDMHAKGMEQPMIDLALATGMPVKISPKYWAEHMGLSYHQAAIRALELPRQGRKDQGFFSKSSGSRSFLRYGYGDLLAENRRYGVLHRIWPGTQRLLLWGDPALAAGYGRASSFCGSMGVEIFEPLSFKGRQGSGLPGGRDACADASLRPGRDYEKYLYEYRLWGRLLYNPDAAPETWQRHLRQEHGAAALACEGALASASRILPLLTTAHTPSAANNNYWPEIYTNMPIVDASRPHPYGDTPSPKRFGMVSPLDPQLFAGVDEFAEALLKGQSSGKYCPIEVAQWLEDLSDSAMRWLGEAQKQVADAQSPAFRRLVADVAIQGGLGRFFAAKLRAGVLYAVYDRTGEQNARTEAIKVYRSGRQTWADMASAAKGIYVGDITFGWGKQLRGHWLDRLPAIDHDIADMEKGLPPGKTSAPGPSPELVEQAIRTALGRVQRPTAKIAHAVPAPFRPGQAVTIEVVLPEGQTAVASIRLYYRRTHQAQPYETADMQGQGSRFAAAIPGSYTDSPYPLEYYFEARNAAGQAWIYPGFDATLSNQPYFIVRQA